MTGDKFFKKMKIFSKVDGSLRPLETSEIVDRVRWSKPTVLKYLKQLRDNNYIEHDGSAWWTGEKNPLEEGGGGPSCEK